MKVRFDTRPEITKEYKRVLRARAASPALRAGTPTAYSSNDVCAFTKPAGSSQALVLVNVRNATVQYPVPAALANTTWTDALLDGPATVGTQVTLPAYGYQVLTK
ncbi:hypothetical protein [Hymenobacter rubripertinctus]|uniref:hypothetical protein n=1 Tax=Hymenobacter rubripertinctus TaxID=2029981 RepID=UPI001602B31B|nr:hypothetical protein [Hymenobacter rubripertinctus]